MKRLKNSLLVASVVLFSVPALADGGARPEGEPLGWVGYVIFGVIFVVFVALSLMGLVRKPDKS